MSYRSLVKLDGDGNILAYYHTPEDQPGASGFLKLDEPTLVAKGRLGRSFVRDRKLVEKAHIRLRVAAEGVAGVSPATVEITGIPEDVPSIRLLVGRDGMVEVPNGQDLLLSWDTPTRVTVRVDPTHLEFDSNTVGVVFK
jgi:hypothetical protein